MPFKPLALIIVSCLLFSCSKPTTESAGTVTASFPSFNPFPEPTVDSSKLILVDASKDGGVWWFPQAGSFTPDLPHQGKALVDYLRSIGFTVHEIPRGAIVTWSILRNYRKVIRASAFTNYNAQELAAYDSLLQFPSSLLLLADHLQYTTNDALSARLGLQFSGSYTGRLLPSTNHPITSGVSVLPYIAGSVLLQPDPGRVTVLGYASPGTNGQAYAAMGIVHHPRCRIFFMGDTNGIEQVPQPFTKNLVSWLF